jgi:uncharacterized membrane protein
MNLQDYKLVFASVALIGVLLIATPALGAVIRLPNGDQFSELYLLGPGHMAENYPFSIATGQNYSIYLGVGNHLGSSAYYVLYVKLGNQTDPLPNATLKTPSSLQPLHEYRFSIQDNANWESLFIFSVSSASISGNNSQINTLQINGNTFNVDKPAMWDSNRTIFKYQFLFELWIYSSQNNGILYNDRFLNLNLNLTKTM